MSDPCGVQLPPVTPAMPTVLAHDSSQVRTFFTRAESLDTPEFDDPADAPGGLMSGTMIASASSAAEKLDQPASIGSVVSWTRLDAAAIWPQVRGCAWTSTNLVPISSAEYSPVGGVDDHHLVVDKVGTDAIVHAQRWLLISVVPS